MKMPDRQWHMWVPNSEERVDLDIQIWVQCMIKKSV